MTGTRLTLLRWVYSHSVQNVEVQISIRAHSTDAATGTIPILMLSRTHSWTQTIIGTQPDRAQFEQLGDAYRKTVLNTNHCIERYDNVSVYQDSRAELNSG